MKLAVPWSCLTEESVVSTSSTKCLIQPDQSSMKSWNNRLSPSQKPESSLLSTLEAVSSPLQIQSEVNTIQTFQSRRILIFPLHFFPDSILFILFLTRLTKFPIVDWLHILLGCILKIVLKMQRLKISLYVPPKCNANSSPSSC